MDQITYIHKICGARVTIEFPTYLGHALTEEALALNRAIKQHQCPVPNMSHK